MIHRNVFPHSTFNWVGIDGTQVLTHMTPGKYDHVEGIPMRLTILT